MPWVGWMPGKRQGAGGHVRACECSRVEGPELVWRLLKQGGKGRFQGHCRGSICETDLLIGLFCSDMVWLSFSRDNTTNVQSDHELRAVYLPVVMTEALSHQNSIY